MIGLLRKFRRNESGATAIEYALIVALISIVAIASWTSIGQNISTRMSTASNSISGAGVAAGGGGGGTP